MTNKLKIIIGLGLIALLSFIYGEFSGSKEVKLEASQLNQHRICADFKNRKELEDYLKTNPKDLKRFDKNNNGIPCEAIEK